MYKKWGLIGDKSRDDMQTFNDCDGAIEAFEKEFLDRSGHQFRSEFEFDHLPGRYAVMEADSEEPSRKRHRCDEPDRRVSDLPRRDSTTVQV